MRVIDRRLNQVAQIQANGSTLPREAATPAAFAEAVQSGTADHVVIFGAAWSRPARQMADRAARLAQRHPVDVIAIDVEAQPDIVRRYPVSAVPTLLLFRNGQVAGCRIGELSEAQLETWLRS